MAWLKLKTALALGLPSVARVVRYRLGLRLGLNPVRRLRAAPPVGPFFELPGEPLRALVDPTPWLEAVEYFGWFRVPVAGSAPDWRLDPFTGARLGGDDPWWEISNFAPDRGDIKSVWELSRWSWVPALALAASGGSQPALDRLNSWLGDWCAVNPPYQGPSWMCGQEASIRVIQLALAALLLDKLAAPSEGLVHLLGVHLRRIEPTLSYAIAQDNNHGTSEAAALFIAGSWLRSVAGRRDPARWEALGRTWLENRVRRLIAADGSFSQHSVNYHRLVLDTLSVVEVWRRRNGLAPMSAAYGERVRAAVRWLRTFTDPVTGEAPNMGPNDGAWLLQLGNARYTDHRPTVQLAQLMFAGRAAYPEGPWNDVPRWLGVEIAAANDPPPANVLFDDGGYARLERGPAVAFVRYPRFRHRPSHADALHVDLWLDHENLLRDGGTFSYGTRADTRDAFAGVGGHNTVQFDGRDQMPRVSRFLYGEWLRTLRLEPPRTTPEGVVFAAAYRDWRGAEHARRVLLAHDRMVVTDQVAGFCDAAVLRWRLAPGDWSPAGAGWRRERVRIGVTADAPIIRRELVEGAESRHYLRRQTVPVLEAEVRTPCILRTEVEWVVGEA